MKNGRSTWLALVLGLIATTAPAEVAPSGTDEATRAGRDWWAFRAVEPPPIPSIADEGYSSIRNPIDAFVRAGQAELGLSPSPEADRPTLIRRLSLDLLGLPPSPEEVEAFVADDRPDAYEHLVDRLLASPHHGEREARSWLDLARYADSGGFELDQIRPDAWRYRDWVVEALNSDMPYDRFVALQLAADELAPDEPRHKAALGFLRNGPSVGNQTTARLRMDELDDIVGTTSLALLGLTVACARCHDHKHDPIPTDDYYRLVAVFAPGAFADVSLATAEEQVAHRLASRTITDRVDRLRQEASAIERAARDRLDAEARAALPEAWRLALESGDLSGLSADDQAALSDRITIAPAAVERALSADERATREALKAEADRAEAERPPPLPKAPGVVESGGRSAPVHVLIRGRVEESGIEVRPGPPRAVAGQVIDFPEPSRRARSTLRRAALATWIASAENPLTARVQANRIWQGHFGRGLVATPSDFGVMGDAPVLPDLLDWLAAEFVASGWSRKAIHRLIVTSATYRQSSRSRSEARAIDPENALLWRYRLRRLEAEAIRDAILRCSGSLNLAPGGPGVFPPIDPSIVRTGNLPRWPLGAREGPEVWRRSLYLFRMRSVPIPLLEVFDQPDTAQSCPERARTTVPTQALTLLNDPFVVEQARRFALRVTREAGPDPRSRLDLAFRLATGRSPGAEAMQAALRFLDRQSARHAQDPTEASTPPDLAALADACHVLLNSNAFLYVD